MAHCLLVPLVLLVLPQTPIPHALSARWLPRGRRPRAARARPALDGCCAKLRLRHPSAPALWETCELQGAQARSQILLEQFEEATLVVPGRVEYEVIEPGIRVLLDLRDNLVGV